MKEIKNNSKEVLQISVKILIVIGLVGIGLHLLGYIEVPETARTVSGFAAIVTGLLLLATWLRTK